MRVRSEKQAARGTSRQQVVRSKQREVRSGCTLSRISQLTSGFLLLASCLLPKATMAYEPGKFYYQKYFKPGEPREKVIALTFDDGPGPFTIPILELLKKHHIRATFFMEGSQIEGYPKIAKQVVDAGHEVGNHTYNHFDYHKVKNAAPERLIHELDQTEQSLERATGIHTKVVRMPHGYFNHTWLLPTLKEKGYALVHWSFGCDWMNKYQDQPGHWRVVETPEQKAEAYIHNAVPGGVFLFHDGGRHREKTLAAVTIVIETLEAKGYHFVAAEDLFKDSKP